MLFRSKDLVGIPKITFVHGIIEAVVQYDIDKALNSIEDVLNQGKDLDNFLWEIIKYVKDLLVFKSSGRIDLYSEQEASNIKQLTDKVSKERLVNLIYELSNLENDIKWSTQKTIMFQAGIIKLCSKDIGSGSDIEERVEKIENYLKSGKLQVLSQSNENSCNIKDISNNNSNYNNKNATTEATNLVEKKTNTTTKTYSNDLNKSWPKIVQDLKQNGKILLYTNLINTNAEQINDSTVGIKFNKGLNSFAKTLLEKQEN